MGARHRAGVLLATGLLTILGINAAFTLPAGIYPEATFPRIAIVVQGGTFEPADMIVAVTRPIEESLSGVIDLAGSAAGPCEVGGTEPRVPARQ
jgi:multidrug efflux pump subunit AcrB